MSFRNLIIGKKFIANTSEYKRVALTGYLSVVCVAVSLIYTFVDISHEVYYSLPSYIVLFSMPIIAILLLRSGNYKSAKVSLMISVNMVVFWAALNDPFETGTFMFFIPTGIGSFAVLGFHDRVTGIFLAAMTTILFILAYFSDLQPVAISRPSETYITLSFVLNYFISLTISVLVVYFLMNLNRHSEKELIQKEAIANQQNAELRKVNNELDRFVYSVSHDLRSPLSSILGLTNLAKKTKDPAELNEILNMIQGRVTAQDHFIREIIDYSRNERSDIVAEPVHLHRLVDEVIASLKYNPNADQITFRQQIPPDAIVEADKIRLSVILHNLIGNAIKYHDLKKPDCYIEISYMENPPAISVKDNGIGIPAEHQERIFDMFYRGSDRSTGSGLGLFITKEAVNKMHGSIRVESRSGEGSNFIVHLTPRNRQS